MGKRIELDIEEKVWLVEECIAGRMRGREAARRAGVGSSTMHSWISRYRAEGKEALEQDGNLVLDWVKEYRRHSGKETGGDVMAKRTYTLEERVQAVKEHLEKGKSFTELAQTYDLSTQLVRSWVRKYREMGLAELEDRRGQRMAKQTPRTPEEELRIRNAGLERENDLLKMELDLLKKVKELERVGGDR